jgi:hypothetical protein
MEVLTALDPNRFLLDDLERRRGRELVSDCRSELHRPGLFNLDGLLRADAVDCAVANVALLFDGEDVAVSVLPLVAGTLNVFHGRNTAHRISPVQRD